MDVGAEPGQGQRAPPGSHVRATRVAGALPPGKVSGPLHHQQCHHRASCEPREQPERWRGWERGTGTHASGAATWLPGNGNTGKAPGGQGKGWGWGVQRGDGLKPGGSARAPGWGVPLLRPFNLLARVTATRAEATSPPFPQRPQSALATTRRVSARGSAPRGFGGTGVGNEAQGTAMADAAETLGEKRLRTRRAPSRARRGSPAGRRAPGSALRC